jgi:hypothetical protein
MSFFPKPSSPRAAWRDLVTFVRHREREHFIGASLAVLVTLIIVIIFLVDPKVNTAPPEQVTYAEIYPANRTDAEIIADQKKDAAARAEFKRKKQEAFRKIDKDLGRLGF